ncbi:MAG: ABC transporter permease [Candidatus Aureabacteria bacterium]|nr:ABC transporter permease [Candidatus Auribacterota bacterium]
MRLALEKRETLPFRIHLLLPVGAVGISFLLSFVPILCAGANPFTAYSYIFYGALGTKTSIVETLVKTAPLILTGLCAAIAFKSGFYNLGGEGQFYLGALTAAALGICTGLPPQTALPLIIAAGFAAGGIWAFGAAVLKTKFRVDEVVVTLLSNYIVIYVVSALLDGPLKDPRTMWPNSPTIMTAARYPLLLGGTRLHAGVLVAIIVALLAWVIMRKTTLGFEIAATGANPKASAYAGIPVIRTVLIASFLSGGVAGLAGVGEVSGLHYNLIEKISPGYGYAGIVIAMLGELNPVGVVLAAFLFGTIITGAQMMSRVTGVPVFLADVIQGITLLVMLAVLILTSYRIRVSLDHLRGAHIKRGITTEGTEYTEYLDADLRR